MRRKRQSRAYGIIQRRHTAKQMRRSGEFLIALIVLLITAPLMLGIALAIKWESQGKVFQTRERIGEDGRRFRMLSFRRNKYDAGQRFPGGRCGGFNQAP